MKKILIISLLSICSCSTEFNLTNKDIKSFKRNIKQIENWLYIDYEAGDIQEYVASNYLFLIKETQKDLNKLQTKYDNQ